VENWGVIGAAPSMEATTELIADGVVTRLFKLVAGSAVVKGEEAPQNGGTASGGSTAEHTAAAAASAEPPSHAEDENRGQEQRDSRDESHDDGNAVAASPPPLPSPPPPRDLSEGHVVWRSAVKAVQVTDPRHNPHLHTCTVSPRSREISTKVGANKRHSTPKHTLGGSECWCLFVSGAVFPHERALALVFPV